MSKPRPPRTPRPIDFPVLAFTIELLNRHGHAPTIRLISSLLRQRPDAHHEALDLIDQAADLIDGRESTTPDEVPS